MGVLISESVAHATHMLEEELKQEIGVLQFEKGRWTR